MKELVKQYIDQGISRRKLMANLSAAGLSAVAVNTVAQALAPVSARAAAASPGAVRDVTGTGGQLYLQQLKAAGVEYYFFNPSTGDAPIFDAFVDEPAVQLIKGVQEGVVVAMADGYARLSGKVGVCSVANVGLPNGVTQLVNTYKDRIPLLLVVGAFPQEQVGRDGPQEYEHQENMLAPLTKWYWQAQSVTGIPETVRRAFKFAATPPGGPVFLAIPDNMLRTEGTAAVMDKALFDVPMRIRADQKDVEAIARLLIEAKNPLLSVGDEITLCQAESEVVELAELLGLPVAGGGEFGVWSKPFPTRNPLYLGPVLANMRFPSDIDLRLNLGNQYGERRTGGATLVSIRRDPVSLARVSPVDLASGVGPQASGRRPGDGGQESGNEGAPGGDRRGSLPAGARLHQRHGGSAPGHAEGVRQRIRQRADQAGAPRLRVGDSAGEGHDLRQRRRFRQENGPVPVLRRRR